MRVHPQGVRVKAATEGDRNDKGYNIGTCCRGHWMEWMEGASGRGKKLGQGKTLIKREVITEK